ncbi:Glycosyltransferase WecB/TagA/CpsF family [Cupriavidus taiwanensis]|uniref:Glycosyltransferase WecB/TagA/CpsF family n=1 Tax=Cupriavidus taiwanensis TaxID=164546 RepID=A0A375BKH6_9BURK|nr:WecB/TagA/CpsF family glycosyltransferase [Cupriavidus taiwanensis]SOY46848.1 Glycosyltransferase WecB/TagA/CpsF family [Cupriavidus taiwanensis]
MKFLLNRLSASSELPTRDGVYTFLNPYSYLIARRNPEIFERFDGIYIDGQLLAKMLSAVLRDRVTRTSFDMTSLAPKLMESAENNDKTVYLIGAKSKQIDIAAAHFQEKYPKLKICGLRHGYFSSAKERSEVIRNIVRLAPDYVIVGMGTPIQEEFLLELAAGGWRGQAFTCGGFLHQSSERLTYYPAWVNKLHLRAPFRAFKEPRLLRRYLISYPYFIAVFAMDWLTSSHRVHRKT